MTLYVECTYTHHSALNTGIQRVVRNLLDHLPRLAEDEKIEVKLIALYGKTFHLIETLQPLDLNLASSAGTKPLLKEWYFALRKEVASRFDSYAVQHFLLAPKYEYGLNYLIDRSLHPFRNRHRLFPPIEVAEGDIILLLDSSWHLDIWPEVKRFKASGAKVLTVVYDLIPLTHSQFCDDTLVWFFEKWSNEAFKHSDGFCAISQSVEADVCHAVGDASRFYAHFLLGSEIKTMRSGGTLPPKLVELFQDKAPTFLLVGTIEPRKNHAYLLDAFDLLWRQGRDFRLLFVGRLGWKNEQTLGRIYTHERYNRQLFMFNDLDDAALRYCYENATMLLFPSFAEGYGLPIIESLRHGLPVMASDIHVHREVGQDNIGYFDLSDPADLVEKIMQRESLPFIRQRDSHMKTTSWQESAETLFNAIKAFANDV